MKEQIELSEEDLKEILTDWAITKKGKLVTNIFFGEEITGYHENTKEITATIYFQTQKLKRPPSDD